MDYREQLSHLHLKFVDNKIKDINLIMTKDQDTLQKFVDFRIKNLKNVKRNIFS